MLTEFNFRTFEKNLFYNPYSHTDAVSLKKKKLIEIFDTLTIVQRLNSSRSFALRILTI